MSRPPDSGGERPHAVEANESGQVPAPSGEGWVPPTVTPLGSLAELLKAGGGKTSVAVDGDGRKPGGSG